MYARTEPRGLQDDARYLFIRLCLRKSNKWHRLSSLKYQHELGDRMPEAIRELCQLSNVKNGECESDIAARCDPTKGCKYSYLAEDDSSATLRELLDCLSVEELKQVMKQMKFKLAKNVSNLCQLLRYIA